MVVYHQLMISEAIKIKKTGCIKCCLTSIRGFKAVLEAPLGNALPFFLRYPDSKSLEDADVDSLSIFLKSPSKGRFSEKKARAILRSTDINIADSLTDTRVPIISSHIRRLMDIQEELFEIKETLTSLVKTSSY
jgi:hypothetical protein